MNISEGQNVTPASMPRKTVGIGIVVEAAFALWKLLRYIPC